MLELKLKTSWNYKGQKGSETFFHTAIGNFTTAMRDWAPAFRVIAREILEPYVQRQFLTQGQGQWADLAPSTTASKEREGYWGGRMGILIGSGELMGSFLAGSPAHVEQIDRQSIKWGSRVPHALFHQTGTGTGFQRRVKGSGRGMPMRKIIDLNAAAKRAMRSVMVQRMSTIARREGFGISTGLGLDPLAARMVGLSALGL